MVHFTVVTAALFIASLVPLSLAAQTASGTPEQICPTVSVNAPDSINEGSSFFFTANVAGGDPNVTPTYNWVVSTGSVSKGQGTSTIEVETNGLGTQTITATVEIGGYRRTCATTDSASAYVVKRPESKKFEDFSPLAVKAGNARLDNFAIELQNNPGSQGYILGYGGRRSSAGTGQKTADSAKNYLVKTRKLDSRGLVTVDGGYKEEASIELWIVPSGAAPPKPSPTVDPSELKTAKPARRGKKS